MSTFFWAVLQKLLSGFTCVALFNALFFIEQKINAANYLLSANFLNVHIFYKVPADKFKVMLYAGIV